MSRPQPEPAATIDPEQLVSRAATQLGTVAGYMSDGSPDSVYLLATATRRLAAVVAELDRYAAGRAERAEILRAAAEIALSHETDPDPYGRAMAGLDEPPPRRSVWRRLRDHVVRGGGRRDA